MLEANTDHMRERELQKNAPDEMKVEIGSEAALAVTEGLSPTEKKRKKLERKGRRHKVSRVHPDWVWKVEWSLRTALSTGVAVAFLLAEVTRNAFEFDGFAPNGPSFAGFITVMVADVTYGRTILNAWGCILVASCTSLATAMVLAAAGESYSPAVALPCLAVLTFLIQVLHLPPMGKRLGLSLVALNLISSVPAAHSSGQLWLPSFLILVEVLLGTAFALVGTLLPWPRLATTELHSRSQYTAGALGEVIEVLLEGIRKTETFRSSLLREHRRELLLNVTNNIRVCRSRLLESRFGPRRRDALTKDATTLKMLDEIFMSAKVLCDIFEEMDFSRAQGIDKIILICSEEFSELKRVTAAAFTELESEIHVLDKDRNLKICEAIQNAAVRFELAYYNAREQVYYSKEPTGIESNALLTLNSFLFELDILHSSLCNYFGHPVRFGFGASPRGAKVVQDLESEEGCCDNQLFHDLLPSQVPLLNILCPLSEAGKRQLVVSFKLSLSMTIAAIYGFYAFPNQGPQSLPAFTIAYIGTDIVQGSNVSMALLRAFATATAAVYASLVATVGQNFSAFGRDLFVWVAIVLFVIPSTYARATESISYAGTVAGFTATLLLLEIPTNSVDALSEDRILDTFVGTFIFMFVEVLILPLRSERQLLDRVVATIFKIKEDFLLFHNTFSHLSTSLSLNRNAFGSSTNPSPIAIRRSHSDLDLSPGASEPGRVRLAASYAERISLIEQQKQLQDTASKEPDLWRVTVKAVHMQALLDAEERAVLFSLQLARLSVFASENITHVLSNEESKKLLAELSPEIQLLVSHLDPSFQVLIDMIGHLMQSIPAYKPSISRDEDKHFQYATLRMLHVSNSAKLSAEEVIAHVSELRAKLTSCFFKVVLELQKTLSATANLKEAPLSSDSLDRALSGLSTERLSNEVIAMVPSNAEIKFVSSLLFASVQFLQSVVQLAHASTRAQAARILSSTQRPYSLDGAYIQTSWGDFVSPCSSRANTSSSV